MVHPIQQNHTRCFKNGLLSLAVLLCLVFIVLSAGCTQKTSVGKDADSTAKGQPANTTVKALDPGLEVYYLDGFWRHIKKMPKSETFTEKGRQGKSILKIDHRFGKKEVFGSGSSRGIGIQMEGFIRLSRTGQWQFKARSNDGIDIKIAQTQVVWDPTQHSDRFSNPMSFSVPEPGFYLLQVRYFQRKGTATLEFYWKPPGEDGFAIIPGTAFWHLR